MVITSRHKPYAKAYTIIESLVVLGLLAVLTVVIIALLKHGKEPEEPAGKAPAGLSETR